MDRGRMSLCSGDLEGYGGGASLQGGWTQLSEGTKAEDTEDG